MNKDKKKKEIKKRHLQGFAILIIYHPDNFQVLKKTGKQTLF